MNKALVLIPTYNERDNIAKIIDLIFYISPGVYLTVVDDDSPDGTGALVENLKDKYPHLDIIHRRERRGYGFALRDGFKRALEEQFDVILTIDADISQPPALIPEFIELAEKYDVIIGSRYVAGGKIEADWGVVRKMVSQAGSLFAKTMLALPVNDCTSGFRGYRAEILKKIDLDKMNSNGYSFLIEILNMSRNEGATFFEAPITYVDRQHGKSKLSRKIVVEALFLVLRLTVKRFLRKPQGGDAKLST